MRQVDYSSRDYEGFRTDLINMLKDKMPEYTDFSQSDAGIVILELLAHGLDLLSYYNDVVANEVFLPTARERESVIKRAGSIGYTLGNATSSKFMQVFEIIPQLDDYVIPAGTRVTTLGDDIEQEVIFELDEDLVILAGDNGLETDMEENYIYEVSITQGQSVYSEILGTSNEYADQKFKLGYKPVIEDSVRVYVNEGAGSFQWDRVLGFLNSDQDSRHYIFSVNEQDEATITFGSGLSGRIPSNFINGISATYKIGGGNSGNVAPNTITEMPNKPALVVQTFNPESAYQVALNRESIESAKVKAPANLRTLYRAVTLQDFADLALTQKNVRLASSVKNEIDVRVDVIVLTEGIDYPTVEEIAVLTQYFADKVLLGIDYMIMPPTYQDIEIGVEIITNEQHLNATVYDNVTNALKDYFKVGNRNLGEPVILSKLISLLSNVRGVESVSLNAPFEDVMLTKYELPRVDELNLSIGVTGGKGGDIVVPS